MEGPTQHMPPPPSAPPPGYGGGMAGWQGARMPVPGNAEWLLWLVVEVVFAIIWAASNVTAFEFMIVTAIVTLGYLVSRGIAKAGKVLEQ
jgi:hypothetical protein